MLDNAAPEPSKEALRVELVPQKSGPKSKWEHPLVIALFSFLLTGILGAIISYQIQRRNAEIDRNAKHYEASTTAIARLIRFPLHPLRTCGLSAFRIKTARRKGRGRGPEEAL
jgi:hypothetical protein